MEELEKALMLGVVMGISLSLGILGILSAIFDIELRKGKTWKKKN